MIFITWLLYVDESCGYISLCVHLPHYIKTRNTKAHENLSPMFLTLRLSQKAHIQHWEKNLTHISAMWEFMNVGNWKRITDKRSTCILRLLIFSESPAGFVLLLLPQREIFEYHRQASWVSNGHFKLYVGNVICQRHHS